MDDVFLISFDVEVQIGYDCREVREEDVGGKDCGGGNADETGARTELEDTEEGGGRSVLLLWLLTRKFDGCDDAFVAMFGGA